MFRKVMKSVIYFECIFVIIPNCESALSKSSEKTEYNYAFDVHLVDSCPVNESDWQAAAARIGCNSTRGYHCVPDIFHSTLIEFCYNISRISVSKGNCLELSANGILNHVNCQNFIGKCPDTSYFSDKIYEYPICQNVESGCFTSDLECFRQKLKVLQTETRIMRSNSTHSDCEEQRNLDTPNCDLPLLILVVVLLVVCVISHIVRQTFIFWISKMKNRITYSEEKEEEEEERQQLLPCQREAGKSDTELSGKKSAISDDFLYILMELESEGLVENTYLSQLLRRHCRNGTFRNFEYLFQKRILPKKNDSNVQNILTSCDKDGYTLLHCAAEGGSVKIFEELISVTDQKRVEDTTYDGRTVLHIACKNGNLSLCESLMFYKELLKKKSNQGWNALHYAAANGSTKIVNLLEKNGLDIIEVTTNGLSILDIACLHNHEELCKTLMNRDDLSQLFYKADAQGWIVAHFAAMAGNKDILKYIIKKNLNIRMTTNRTKNVLHVSCEYGNYEICAEILDRYDSRESMNETDDENWNALHYAAKGGNLKVYKTVEKFYENSARLSETTCDEKTVLHIACINKRTEICQYICDQESYTGIINSKVSLKGWTAAHYTAVETKQDRTEEKLIRMLVESGIDLKAVTTDGLTVLGVACEHRNRNLINYLLKTHSELLGVGIPYLKSAAKASNDFKIQSQIYEALENYKGKIVDIIAEKKTT